MNETYISKCTDVSQDENVSKSLRGIYFFSLTDGAAVGLTEGEEVGNLVGVACVWVD